MHSPEWAQPRALTHSTPSVLQWSISVAMTQNIPLQVTVSLKLAKSSYTPSARQREYTVIAILSLYLKCTRIGLLLLRLEHCPYSAQQVWPHSIHWLSGHVETCLWSKMQDSCHVDSENGMLALTELKCRVQVETTGFTMNTSLAQNPLLLQPCEGKHITLSPCIVDMWQSKDRPSPQFHFLNYALTVGAVPACWDVGESEAHNISLCFWETTQGPWKERGKSCS